MNFIRTVADALNSNYVVRRAKDVRDHVSDLSFRARGKNEAQQLLGRLEESRTTNVCFTVAFNVPWVVETMIEAWSRYPTGLELVVVNNSSDRTKRAEIEAVCQRYGTPYLNLPLNLERHPCRSHGIAMNWVYYNVVRPLKPDVFGFIDHDCFPTKPYNLPDRLKDCDVFGLRFPSIKVADAWNMWAGFCFYRFAAINTRPLDFKNRVELGLDTGGGNWKAIYRSMASNKVVAASYQPLGQSAEQNEALHILIDDAFLHVGGASFRAGNDRDVAQRVRQILFDRADLGTLIG